MPTNSCTSNNRAMHSSIFSRREMLSRSGLGFGSLALGWMLGREGQAYSPSQGAAQGTRHFPPRAKAIIQLMQNGGPSQMDLFDPKPELQKRGGQKSPIQVE